MMRESRIIGICGWTLFCSGMAVAILIVSAPFLMGQRSSLWPAEKVRVTGLTATTLQDAIDTGELAGGGTSEFCKTIEVPASAEEFYTIWRAPAALTLVEIYGDCIGGTSVVFDFEIDSGSINAVNGGDITATCDGAGTEISSPGGTVAMADGDRLDLDLGAVTDDVDLFSACIRYTLD